MSWSKASAPGSLMVLGEHAVLNGKRALALAVDRRISVHLHPRKDDQIHLSSDLGTLHASLASIPDQPAFRFAAAVLRAHQSHLSHGLDLHIESDFPATVGLGSSAAVTAALHAALCAHRGIPSDPGDLFPLCFATIHEVQGLGSGTDLAASLYGGMVAYRMKPSEIMPLECAHPITVVYSGGKTPTVEVVQAVRARQAKDPGTYHRIFDEIDAEVEAAVEAIELNDWATLGMILDRNHALMQEMQLSTATLDEIVDYLRNRPDIAGAKISGSGLGDCVIGWGHANVRDCPYEVIPVKISQEGVRIE